MIFQLIEFFEVTVLVTGGTLFVTGPPSTRKMITWRLVSRVLGLGLVAGEGKPEDFRISAISRG
jgi:hypothetical protein